MSKCVEKKKLLVRQRKGAKWLFNYFLKLQKQPPDAFHKKAVLLKISQYSQYKQENTCIGKYLCRGLFLIQNIEKFSRAPILKKICFWKCVIETKEMRAIHMEF